MIAKYIPRNKRKAHSAMMLRAKQRRREALGVDAETLRWRAMRDASFAAADVKP